MPGEARAAMGEENETTETSRSRPAGIAATLAAAAALAAVAVGWSAPPAGAATAKLSGDRLMITGGPQPERIQLRRADDAFVIDERRRDGALDAGAGCTAVGERRAECPAATVRMIAVTTAAGNDRFFVGRSFPARDERGGCRGNRLGAALAVRLGPGRDYAETSKGDDVLRGGADRDVLLGCQGDDELAGGAAGDRVSGDKGDDSLSGNAGPDWVVGCVLDPDDINFPADERGRDTLRGGGGGDFLFGCHGRDRYLAGSGKDTLNTRDRTGERVNCGGATDLAYVDSGDRLRSCELLTNCTTDNFPFVPCSARAGAAQAATGSRSASVYLPPRSASSTSEAGGSNRSP